MRGLLLAFTCLTSATGQAQNWCPPGATWTYSISDDLPYEWEGYTVLTYARDTLIAGQPGQVISSHSVVQLSLGGTQVSDVDVAIITRTNGPLVHINGGSDTLYAFNAVPGDHWYGSGYAQVTCPGEPFVVMDTGHVLVDGMSLRYLDINNGMNGQHRIMERVGYALSMVPQLNCQLPSAQSTLRCYHDDQIDYVAPGWSGPCTGFVGILEAGGNAGAVPWPNPGTDHFTLALAPGPHLIRLFDATGHMVLAQQTVGSHVSIGTTPLSPGLYSVRIDEGACLRWLKD